MISSGDHGEVYRGILLDGERVIVKKFTSRSDNVDAFIEEVEAIWCIRHKNLVKLLGYSIEGDKRLVYLHEDSEPIVVHQHLKSSSILLDRQWNPRISDIGITKLIHPQSITHSLTGMSGYIDPAYIFATHFKENNDMYSFGVVILEILTGNMPVEIVEFGKKEYLVEWVKSKICDKKLEDIVDQNLQDIPSSKEFKRILLIALRCVDPEVENRPTFGDVIHMLQPRDLLLDDDSIIDT
ncbi:putative serine/threonine-protein kinase At1g01540 [Bidens hawaiensis]|uniref:putative serine/threonine-protein kinase At1g01540 n=1 Tax=Bidens hawaiensis TaxID=980011 RepID=UPI00404B95FF